MKREKILWPLTHGHQHALSAAKAIQQRLTPTGSALEGLREEVREFWDLELKPHFQAEEELLQLLAANLRPRDPDVVRFFFDHRTLGQLLSKGFREDLLRFADLLVKHVRFEEEVLFGRVERAMSPPQRERAEEILKKAVPSAACPRLLAPRKD